MTIIEKRTRIQLYKIRLGPFLASKSLWISIFQKYLVASPPVITSNRMLHYYRYTFHADFARESELRDNLAILSLGAQKF